MSMARSGNNLIFTHGNGPAGGTNYLCGTTNLGLPMAQWNRLATNKFDLSGMSITTNTMSAGTALQFYRVGLP